LHYQDAIEKPVEDNADDLRIMVMRKTGLYLLNPPVVLCLTKCRFSNSLVGVNVAYVNDALAGSGVGVGAMSWKWIWLECISIPFYPNTAVRSLIALDTNLIEFDHDRMDLIT